MFFLVNTVITKTTTSMNNLEEKAVKAGIEEVMKTFKEKYDHFHASDKLDQGLLEYLSGKYNKERMKSGKDSSVEMFITGTVDMITNKIIRNNRDSIPNDINDVKRILSGLFTLLALIVFDQDEEISESDFSSITKLVSEEGDISNLSKTQLKILGITALENEFTLIIMASLESFNEDKELRGRLLPLFSLISTILIVENFVGKLGEETTISEKLLVSWDTLRRSLGEGGIDLGSIAEEIVRIVKIQESYLPQVQVLLGIEMELTSATYSSLASTCSK